MTLSDVLKRKGHETDVLIHAIERDLISELTAVNPDLIGFSVHSAEHKWLREMTVKIREHTPDIPIIVGGIHATLYPEEVMKLNVDYLCRGEGELSFPALVERLSNNQPSASGIPGIGYFEKGQPVLPGLSPLASDLDMFREDRQIYYGRYPEIRDLDLKMFMSGRGCPFQCAYCGNALLKEAYKNTGEYIRKKSPRFFVEEIKTVIDRYGAKSFYFMDDLFILPYGWLKEFADIYGSEIALPYFCLGHASIIKEKHAKLLIGSGCDTISFGLETGNELIRRNILNKNIPDSDFYSCSNILKRAGIRIATSNMFCLPDESEDDATSTIDLNIRIGTSYMATSVFLPYPKTKLAEYCIEKGLLDRDYSVEDIPTTFLFNSILKKDNKTYFENIQKIAMLCLLFPRVKPLLVFMAKKIRFKILFEILYLIGAFLRYKSAMKLTVIQTIKYFWTQRKQTE